jgi:hypothetical protein
MKPLPDGRLLVADARRGLVRIDPASGSCEDMLTHAKGSRCGAVVDDVSDIQNPPMQSSGCRAWL